mgnify:FL=1
MNPNVVARGSSRVIRGTYGINGSPLVTGTWAHPRLVSLLRKLNPP